MLDAGSLRGLKLQIRRVKDEDKSGFEVLFRLTDSKIEGLEKRLIDKGAKRGSVIFRGAEEGDDGVCRYTANKALISTSSTHAPPDIDSNAKNWALSMTAAKGGDIELVADEAAMSLRGLVRIDLRGTDTECTKQLDDLIKSLGLGFIFAPPTPKSKKINQLMRVLFQHDHKSATELSKKDLSKLKVEDLETALKDAGFSQTRIDALSYEEVFDGHFTVVDPQQAEDMAKAGARYMYSTVREPGHVHSILLGGQKSSMQRYYEGAIINGMSTNSDFITGGAVGVFTRLVTQDSIYAEQSWTGRTYKIIQNYSQLGRTDWYGWNGDKFGRRWDLNSDENFGASLIGHIDSNGSYKRTNELIFTAGNRPENIDRVVATNEKDRQALIDLLKEEKYKPHNDLSIEEFVIMEPKFFVFGPSPYDCKDPKAFAKEALKEAEDGNPALLKWLLIEGPSNANAEKAKLESKILLGDDKDLRKVVLHALKLTGTFSMNNTQLDKLLAKLSADDNPENKKALKEISKTGAEALFASDSEAALKVIQEHNSGSPSNQLHGVSYDNWVDIIGELLPKQSGTKRSKTLSYVLENQAQKLIDRNHDGFLQLISEQAIVKMPQSAAWIKAQIKKAKETGAASLDLNLYLAQSLKDDSFGELQAKLIEADSEATLQVLKTSIMLAGGFNLAGDKLASLITALPENSKTRKHLLSTETVNLLQLAEPKLLKILDAHYKDQPSYGLSTHSIKNLIEGLIEREDDQLSDCIAHLIRGSGGDLIRYKDFRSKLAELPDLYDFSAGWTFAEAALQELTGKKTGQIKIAGLMASKTVETELKRKVLSELLKSSDSEAKQLADWLIEPDQDGKTMYSTDVLHELMSEFDNPDQAESMKRLLSRSGRPLLASANLDQLPLLEKNLSDGQWRFQGFGFNGAELVSVLKDIDQRSDSDSNAVFEWALTHGASEAMRQDNNVFSDYLKEKKLDRSALGKDPKWAGEVIKDLIKGREYYYTGNSYGSSNQKEELPASAMWLLKSGGENYDDAVLKQVEKDIKKWKFKKDLVEAFVERCTGLSEDWQKRLKKAAKKSPA